MSMIRRRWGLRLILWFCMPFGMEAMLGQAPQGEEAAQAPRPPGPSDRVEIEAFLDGLIHGQIKSHDLAGVTVAVVRDGQVLFAKGYGYADVDMRTPVDPEKTLFRIGSVSKLFTWTAVMQLVEEGKLDLNADVNRYLGDLRIPDTYPEPITLTHLLTHTPGFEDRVIGLFASDTASLIPIQEVLRAQMPERVRPPGDLASYSNHGTALAGLIVAQASGMPWAEFIEERILKPLDMRYASVRQPLPGDLEGHMAKGYSDDGGLFEKHDFELVPAAPAGSMSASALSMANFMIAHLRGGAYGENRILQESTARRMREVLHRHDPRVNAMLYGFIQYREAPLIYGHGGDTLYFHSDLLLFPESDTGFFVSSNSAEGGAARGEIVEAFLDRYFPRKENAHQPLDDVARQRAEGLKGTYGATRIPHSTLARIASLVSAVTVGVDSDGYLTVAAGGRTQRYSEIEPYLYENLESRNGLLFRLEEDRTILFLRNLPILAFVKHSTTQSPGFQIAWLAISLLLLLSALILWPINAWAHRRGISIAERPRRSRFGRPLAGLMSLLLVAFFVLLAIALSDPSQIVFGVPPLLKAALWLPLLSIPAVLGVLWMTWRTWKDKDYSALGRLHYTTVALAGAALLWWCYNWNLLGFHY